MIVDIGKLLSGAMSLETSNNEGVELASRHMAGQAAQTLLQAASDELPAPRARRRSTLAGLRQDLHSLEAEQPMWRRQATWTLWLYTVARIVANFAMPSFVHFDVAVIADRAYEGEYFSVYDDVQVACDAILRPLVTGLGLYVFVHRMDRLSGKNKLHVWSLLTICCLALPTCDESIEQPLRSRGYYYLPNFCMAVWQVLCNVLQVYMTSLKLQALGWPRVARCSNAFAALGVGSLISFLLFVWLHEVGLSAVLPFWTSALCVSSMFSCFGCSFIVLSFQCYTLCRAAGRAMTQAAGNDSIKWTARLLYANSCLVLLGPFLSFSSLYAYSIYGGELPRMLVTLDVSFQVCNVVFLSGMVGTMPMNLAAFKRLAELSGFGLASARVAFQGHISHSAQDCIVSFPGKYSESWDKAVSSVTQEDMFSLACVFLTDAASGLGQHAYSSDTPGQCWCHEIYGQVPATTYLSMVEMGSEDQQNSQQTLAFKKADADAMGQRLLIREDQGDLEWEQECAEALLDAEARCAENQYRAPWGCQWFEAWKKNVDRAREQGQVLHVFYFKDSKGKGKMSWEQLCDEQAKREARKDSGLGVSQTAEVAYLDKFGLSYEEHGIEEFEAFLRSHADQVSPRSARTAV